MLDYIRIACAVPKVKVGNVKQNSEDICARIAESYEKQVDVLVFPELAVTGYTCADLFFQDVLLKSALDGLKQIVLFTKDYPGMTVVFGLPVSLFGQLYNCAAVVSGGVLLGIVPKTFLPNYGEFSEKRWFASAAQLPQDYVDGKELGLDGEICVSASQLFRLPEGALLGVELCEDVFAPIAPSAVLALAGAQVIVNPAACNETVGKRKNRHDRVVSQSAGCSCVYALCSAGCEESTQDLVFSGHSLIAVNGKVMAENKNLIDSDYLLMADCDLGMVRSQRSRINTFRDAANYYAVEPLPVTEVPMADALRADGSLYTPSRLPFVPDREEKRIARCLEVFQIQVAGLKRRLTTIGTKAVIGISGGLDSTLALLVTVEAMRQLGRPMTDVYGVTMPCFGTSDRTYQNAWELMKKLGISSKEVNIRDAVMTHFRDIGHDFENHDATFENAQARERTQILMDYAGEVGGIVIGTGDLSELALGWCTYNGDHMSMYSVNGSVPKTLIRWIILAVAEQPAFASCKAVLDDILDTPISPELLPPDATGKISQQTEDIVGPYALHDFYLYYMLRYGFSPTKIYTLACRAFADVYDYQTVKKWLVTFYRRFFSQQFKRNCQPDGVKTGNVGVGPRGDLHMPSDACATLWLEEAQNL